MEPHHLAPLLSRAVGTATTGNSNCRQPADLIVVDQSFAGNRDRGSVNQTYIEPEISYNFESGWYVQCDPPMTYDWTADAADAWTIPMGADIGKAFKLGSRDLSLQVGAYDLLKRPEGNPQWIARVSVTLLFPHGH